jgi:inner membrane protein
VRRSRSAKCTWRLSCASFSSRTRKCASSTQRCLRGNNQRTLRALDNVTHSLFGYALGRAIVGARAHDAARVEPASRQPLERALLASSVLASNAPDLDFIVGFFGGDRRLIYLLEHRGLSHTLLLAVVLGALTGLGCALAYRLRDARERLAVALLGAAACLLHIGCDFLNDYGVHPFYPFDDRWFYGDSVFIVEPLWIAVLLPLPAWFGWSRSGRVLSRVLAVGLLALCGFVLPAWRAVAVTAVLLAAVFAQRRLGPRGLPALSASIGLVGVFAIGSQLGEAQVREALERAVPAERILDLASSPAPADPTCHRVLAVSLDAKGTYRARVATSQLFGPSDMCRLLPSDPTAPLRAADVPNTQRVSFGGVFAAPAEELQHLAKDNCDAAALMRFIRIPFWLRQSDGEVLGDLRYDRAPSLEFAERKLTGACDGVAAFSRWAPPRSDVLDFPSASTR